MRQKRPTTLILAVSLALFANAALAQRATPGGVRATGTIGAAPTASGPALNAGTSATVNAGNSVNANTSVNANVNANTQGSSAVVGNTSGGNQVVFGVPANGTQGSNTGSGVGSPQSRLIDANGNLLVDANGNALVTDGRNVIGVAPVAVGYDAPVMGVDPNQVVVAGATLAPSYTLTVATPELDRATRKELAKARTASKTNKQLLTSIVPRTNVDRTDQMADDPIPLRY
jgi:hypothetical protein